MEKDKQHKKQKEGQTKEKLGEEKCEKTKVIITYKGQRAKEKEKRTNNL